MDVVNVDRRQPQVLTTALDLIGEIAWGHAVSAAHDIVGPHDTRPQVRLGEVRPRVGAGVGVERDVAAFGGHDDLVAAKLPALDALGQHGPDHALTALVAIVHGGVDDVEAALERLTDGAAVQVIGGGVFAAEVGAQAQARQLTRWLQSPVILAGNGGRKPRRVACRAFRRRASVDHDQATR